MHDPRYDKLAETLIGHSTNLQAGENVLIEAFDIPEEMTVALIRAAHKVGARTMVKLRQSKVTREQLLHADEKCTKLNAAIALAQMKKSQAYIGMRGGPNSAELSDVPAEQMRFYTKHYLQPVHLQHRVKKMRWCILRFPNPSMAQEAQMSTEAFEDFFFDVCTMDYSKMQRAIKPLQRLM